jgi:hypothetical protein
MQLYDAVNYENTNFKNTIFKILNHVICVILKNATFHLQFENTIFFKKKK